MILIILQLLKGRVEDDQKAGWCLKKSKINNIFKLYKKDYVIASFYINTKSWCEIYLY